MVISFSIKEEDKAWWEEFSDLSGPKGRSNLIKNILKSYMKAEGTSEVEVAFNTYCIKNNLSKDAQLNLLMGPYRVWNGDDND